MVNNGAPKFLSFNNMPLLLKFHSLSTIYMLVCYDYIVFVAQWYAKHVALKNEY